VATLEQRLHYVNVDVLNNHAKLGALERKVEDVSANMASIAANLATMELFY